MTYGTNKVRAGYFVELLYNQISMTTQFPDFSLTLGLFPDISRIPLYMYFLVSRKHFVDQYRRVVHVQILFTSLYKLPCSIRTYCSVNVHAKSQLGLNRRLRNARNVITEPIQRATAQRSRSSNISMLGQKMCDIFPPASKFIGQPRQTQVQSISKSSSRGYVILGHVS